MSLIDDLKNDAHLRTKWEHGRFYAFLAATIGIALLLVSIAMGMYTTSGTSQLDLSRPGYIGAQKNMNNDTKTITTFPSSGVFDKQAFDDFRKMYDERLEALKAINGYDPAAVNNDSFNLAPQEQPQEG